LKRSLSCSLLAFAAVALAATTAAPPGDETTTFPAAELAAAKAPEIYVVLLPAEPRLELRSQGLALRHLPIADARLGRPRLGGGDLAWPAAEYRVVSELPIPERPRIQPPDPETGEETSPADPRPMRAVWIGRIPDTFRVRLEPELEVRVVGRPVEALEGATAGVDWGARWENLRRLLSGRPALTRLQLVLAEDDARSLYLNLRPGTRFLVQPAP
jgi:hypothetical protein